MKGVRLSVLASAAALLLALPTMAWAQRHRSGALAGVQSSGKYDAKLSAMLRDSLAKAVSSWCRMRVNAAERLCTNAEA